MAAFLLEMLMVVSIGVVLYLLARALPRVSDVDTSPTPDTPAPNWLMDRLEKMDEEILSVAEKFLRRLRVALLKLDNTMTGKLKRFKKEVSTETSFSLEGEEGERKNGNGKTKGGV
ncbi:hypothetical protein COX26_01680 [Candidatus Jorgensenbacteria bacterium CG23_combo_of_CG06-09_8_20_14_all_54_14]|uniref:Uncharacterized protein n=1 Tax=Candidatus Jorgensenbacteria bacterium CG23_combo_of_CG06-09_8_20_14_all_54_14 TaxID=1974595 RepID=A0A2G9Z9Q4_9BACT|nr:MAG: hypothetical protein COX26_01680 [Candidatus Jorgensenbacteria bacterium CG23_combo_of_CG06-09_8_20_14_all_54_14]